jgi:integrase
MAWPEKLPSGKWRGRYRDASGTPRTVDGGPFTHKAAAVRAAAAAEKKARQRIGSSQQGARMLWGDWVAEWWPSRTVEASTHAADLGRLRNHLEPRWADVQLGAIRRQEIRAWAAELGRAGLGPGTVRHCVVLLSVSLAAAVDQELLEANPAAGILKSLPQPPPAMERFLDRDEYQAIRDQLPTFRDQTYADSLVTTGMRWGEMFGAHRARLDRRRGVQQVVEAWSEEAGRIKPHPKGRKIRDVPVPGWLMDAWYDLGPGEEVRSCGYEHVGPRCRSGLLLPTPAGAVLRSSNWRTTWDTAVKEAGVGHVRPHDLRHTYASWLLQGGVSLAEVGRLLGHVSPVTTQRYAWLVREPSTQVLKALGPGFAPRLPHDE